MLPFGLGCAKASILLFYIRIFVTTKRSKRYGIFVANIVLIAMMMIGFFFATLFECGSHISAMWQSAEVLVAYCPNSESYDYGFSISDFITDVIILVMPIPLVSPPGGMGKRQITEYIHLDLAPQYGSPEQDGVDINLHRGREVRFTASYCRVDKKLTTAQLCSGLPYQDDHPHWNIF